MPKNVYYASNQVMTVKVIEKISRKPIKNAIVKVDIDFHNLGINLKTDSNGCVKVKGLTNLDGLGPISGGITITLPAKTYYGYSTGGVDLSKYTYFTRSDEDIYLSYLLKPGKCIVKAPKVVAKHKKTKYFKITVKNKFTKKAIKKLKLKLKVSTGKKSSSYTVKTNSKGVAKFNCKVLSKGKHKVVIKSKNGDYSINKKSLITIK